jgi:uncharacterized membrane protein
LRRFSHDRAAREVGWALGFRAFMTFEVHRLSARVYFGLLTVVPILSLLALVCFAPPDGNEGAQWLQFLGHFHPIAVHLPIATLILVPVFELAGRSRYFPYLLHSVDFLLGVATCGGIAAAGLGWCLARSGSYSGSLVTQHMWGGVSVATAAWLCWFLRARSSELRVNPVYAIALIATMGLVAFTGYRGGQLSQGENHLTEHMPPPLRTWLGLEAFASISPASSSGGTATFYGARIQPIFLQHCVGCHGHAKHKASLRLDSYDAVLHGSKHGPVIKVGNPQGSELFHRVTLPPTDEDFMPAEHKPPLSANEIKRLERWISSGASGTQLAESVKDLADDSGTSTAVAEVSIVAMDPAEVAKQRATLAPVVAQLQQRFPATLDYESRGSANLVINASLLGSKFGDDELASLAPISAQIVAADFSRTSITDRSSGTIASMKNLRSLRLTDTRVTDATVKALTPLSHLESLSLFDTAVTADALTAISLLPKLRRLYAQGTKISPDTPIPTELKNKIIF